MFFITKDGRRITVDNPDYSVMCKEQVTLFEDSMSLCEVWVLELYRNGDVLQYGRDTELEYVADVIFKAEPSRDEIMHAMAKHNLSMSDVVFVSKAYKFGYNNENK